ncbi:MAG: ABC transporter permease [Candidatus Omnitrophica bacterium]|nr:ABC transporter permease [Candidatus Omnitrophota bacterium]
MQRVVWYRVAFFASLLLGWQALYLLRVWPDFLFPSPQSVAAMLVHSLRDGTLVRALGVSLTRLVIGYGMSLAIGLPLGLLTGSIRWLHQTIGALLLGLQTLPSICWLPLALLWFGLNERAIIFVVVMGAVLSISLSAEDGVQHTPRQQIRAAKNMGASGWRLYLQVMLPAALPGIVTGMKLGWSFAWRALMAGELLYGHVGLGHLLMMGRELNDMSQVIAVMAVIVALGLLVDRMAFAPLERRVRERWGTGTL